MIALLWRRGGRIRLVLGIVALALGGGSILGTQLAGSALRSQEEAVLRVNAGQAQYDIEPFSSPGFTAAEVGAVSRLSLVTRAGTLVQKPDLATLPSGAFRQVVLVVLQGRSVALRKLPLTSGSLPSSEFQVAVSQDLAAGMSLSTGARSSSALGLGGKLRLVQTQGDRRFEVTGLVADSGPGAPFADDTVYVTAAAARRLFSAGLETRDLAVRLRPGATVGQLMAQLPSLLHTEYTVTNSRALSSTDPVGELAPLLYGITALSLLLAFTVITTSFASVVVQRRRELGLLRLAGAGRLAIVRSFMLEALAASALGAAGGLGMGYGVAALLIRLTSPPGQEPAAVLRWNPGWTLWSALLVLGLGVLAATAPALQASRTPPLEAVRPAPRAARWPRSWPLVAVLSAVAAYVLFGSGGSVGVALGATLSYLAVCSLLGWLGPRLVAVVGRAVALVLRAPPAAVSARARSHPAGTALALAGLFVSIATATSLVGLSISALDSGQLWVEHLFVGNQLVVSPVPQSARVEKQLLNSIDHSAGSSAVMALAPVRLLSARVGHQAISLAATDPAGYAVSGALQFVHGSRSAALTEMAAGGGALLPLELAGSLHAHLGSRISVSTAGATAAFTVVGVVAHTLPGSSGQESLLVDSAAAARDFGTVASGFNLIQLETRAGPSVQRDVALAAFKYGMEEETVTEVREGVDRGIQHDIAAFTALALVGVVVAVLAAINTVLLDARQGVREMALLRVVGLGRSEVRRAVLAEAVAVALVGCILGVGAGVALIAPEVRAASTAQLPLAFAVPFNVIWVLVAAAVVAVGASALVPARQLGKLDPVAALTLE